LTTGDKIRAIRVFWGMRQKELGMAVGFSEKTADVRIAQYESGSRTPKKPLLARFAKALQVKPQNFEAGAADSAEAILWTLFWLDEDIRRCPEQEKLAYHLRKWYAKRRELMAGKITQEEYFDWKLNFDERSG